MPDDIRWFALCMKAQSQSEAAIYLAVMVGRRFSVIPRG